MHVLFLSGLVVCSCRCAQYLFCAQIAQRDSRIEELHAQLEAQDVIYGKMAAIERDCHELQNELVLALFSPCSLSWSKPLAPCN